MKKKKRFLYKFFLLCVLLIFGYILANFTLKKIIHSKEEVVVPNIEKKSLMEALTIVSKSGLGLKKIGERYDPEFPAGTVLLQQPPAGMVVRKGRHINVILSLGGEKVFVPNIVGEDRRTAEIILRQYDLVIGTVSERYSLKYQKNRVISQEPLEGSIVDKKSSVNFVVSLGFPPEGVLIVPDFVTKPVEEAMKWARENNINVEIKEVVLEKYPVNTVVEQFPSGDSVISSQDKLSLSVVKDVTRRTSSEEIFPQYNFVYELPPMGGKEKNVKIVQVSSGKEIVLYNKQTFPGEKILLYVPQRQSSKIRIFIDGILVDEK